jgi:o-succinylbenzoate synthase
VNYNIQFLSLKFKVPAGTSRGYLNHKPSWILTIEKNGTKGIGEISIIEGLSPEFDNKASFEQCIHDFLAYFIEFCGDEEHIAIADFIKKHPEIKAYPSILFGIESAILDLINGGNQIYFQNKFTEGNQKIPINGLVWMGDSSFMLKQVEDKIQSGFNTIKLKIGALDWKKEIQILETIRNQYDKSEITIRLDANGAFDSNHALGQLKILEKFDIHSIEQPIKPDRIKAMKELCEKSPIPIALDEELIGISSLKKKVQLLQMIQPQYIILKPSLHGGISGSIEWISIAEELNIAWWMTSALESNIGLNTIAQFAGEYTNSLPQGLGTGSLYTNNVPSDLTVENGFIFKNKN